MLGSIGGSIAGSVGGSIAGSVGASIAGSLAGSLAGDLSGGLSAEGGSSGGGESSGGSGSFGGADLGAEIAGGVSESLSASNIAPPSMGSHPPDIVPVFRFRVEIRGIGLLRFQGCSGIGATAQPQAQPPAAPPAHTSPSPSGQSAHGATGRTAGASGAHPSNPPANPTPAHSANTQNQAQGGGTTTTQLPNQNWKWNDITLSTGYASDTKALLEWVLESTKSHYTPHDVTVTVLDLEGKPAITFNFKQAYPKSWTLAALTSKAGDPLIQSLMLTHQGATIQLG